MKNILKNRLCLMLTLALVLALLPSVGGYAAESTGINPVEVTNVKAAKDYTLSSSGVLKVASSVKTLDYSFASGVDLLDRGKVKSLVIPASVTKIDSVDFWGFFYNLEKVEVNSKNKNFKAVKGVLYSKNMKKIIYYPVKKSGKSYTIGSKVTTVGYKAFARQRALTKITVPTTVTKIEGQAFALYTYDSNYMTQKVSVYFKGKAPTKIDKDAFYDCAKVTAYYPQKYASSWKGKTKKYSAWSYNTNDLTWKAY